MHQPLVEILHRLSTGRFLTRCIPADRWCVTSRDLRFLRQELCTALQEKLGTLTKLPRNPSWSCFVWKQWLYFNRRVKGQDTHEKPVQNLSILYFFVFFLWILVIILSPFLPTQEHDSTTEGWIGRVWPCRSNVWTKHLHCERAIYQTCDCRSWHDELGIDAKSRRFRLWFIH